MKKNACSTCLMVLIFWVLFASAAMGQGKPAKYDTREYWVSVLDRLSRSFQSERKNAKSGDACGSAPQERPRAQPLYSPGGLRTSAHRLLNRTSPPAACIFAQWHCSRSVCRALTPSGMRRLKRGHRKESGWGKIVWQTTLSRRNEQVHMPR